ncbi:DUF3047 domain-containing protein [Thermodesulfobacteriota bacterium]
MRRYFIAWNLVILVSLCFHFQVRAAGILVDDYKAGLSPRWEQKSFKGETHYQVSRVDNKYCIKATSNASASGLYYKIDYDLKEYPILNWQWKIDHIITKGNALKKKGDDYAARVYVIFPSVLFWKTKAINYIWASKLPRGKAVPNPFTSNAVMIAVKSGSANAGQWREETRNVYKDFREYFRQDPPMVGAIAIMTDTDNTGEEAVAWYGPIRILPRSGQ